MKYKFTGAKHISRDIQEKLPYHIIDLLWMLLEEKKQKTELDYLQIFKLEAIGEGENKALAITHIQEQPEPFADIHCLLDCSADETGTIYIVDDLHNVTMLWAYEN